MNEVMERRPPGQPNRQVKDTTPSSSLSQGRRRFLGRNRESITIILTTSQEFSWKELLAITLPGNTMSIPSHGTIIFFIRENNNTPHDINGLYTYCHN